MRKRQNRRRGHPAKLAERRARDERSPWERYQDTYGELQEIARAQGVELPAPIKPQRERVRMEMLKKLVELDREKQ